MSDDDLVGGEEARNLDRHFFPAPRRTLNARGFGHIGRHRKRNAAEKLYPLGDGVDDFRLLSVMLVEQEMELIKSWSGNLPMRFLVEVAEGHGVSQQQVERQHVRTRAVLLNCFSTLVKTRLGAHCPALASGCFRVEILLSHISSSLHNCRFVVY